MPYFIKRKVGLAAGQDPLRVSDYPQFPHAPVGVVLFRLDDEGIDVRAQLSLQLAEDDTGDEAVQQHHADAAARIRDGALVLVPAQVRELARHAAGGAARHVEMAGQDGRVLDPHALG